MFDPNNEETLKELGFKGFIQFNDLLSRKHLIPDKKGVYLILTPNPKQPKFLEIGTGGYFKGKNPNVPVDELIDRWILGTNVIYIGKAGGSTSNATLRSRLLQYYNFGQGRNVGHWGGRYIWQLKDSGNLIVCWRTLSDADPGEIETKLIQNFVLKFKKRPFANLHD